MTEASIAALLTNILAMPKALAASATLLIRFCTLWFAVILGGAILFIFNKQLGGVQALEETIDVEPGQKGD